MNMRFYFRTSILLMLFICLLANESFSQHLNFPKPREERLLNDLKLLIWSKQRTDKVTVKLRIHSGSAFDPKDKMGTLALLADIIFPDDGIKKFFEEDLEGSLEVVYDYDYIQINATAKRGEFLTILETLAPAVLNPSINKDTSAKVKARRVELIKKLGKDPSYLAERAVAKKLLGDFPYGRPKEGTVESLQKLDFADILFAKQRFLTSDNATIAVIGKLKSNFVYRAVRRHFGGWGKRTEKIPSSFRLPGKPDSAPETIKATGSFDRLAHFALNGYSRRDNEYFASKIVEKVLNRRVLAMPNKDGEKQARPESVELRSYLLRGFYHVTFKSWSAEASDSDDKESLVKILSAAITQTAFDRAKSELLRDMANRHFSESYLDIDTFRLQSVKDEIKKASAVELADVREILNSIKLEPVAQLAIEVSSSRVSAEKNPDPSDPK